jgi:hypothetical protein
MDPPNPLLRVAEDYISHSTLIRDHAIRRGTDGFSFDCQEERYSWKVRHELEPVEDEDLMSSPKLWHRDKLLWEHYSRFP